MSNPIPFIRAAQSDEGPQLWLTGEVGVDFTFAELQRSLSYYAEGGGVPTLNLYSHGGYLNDATAFYDWADKAQVKFRVRVWGTAMSAMTLIAAAAGRENIEIAPNATWMIHECHGGTEEMNAHGNDAAVRIYRKLTGLSDKKLREMMAATTTLNAQQAVEMGFAARVIKTSIKLAAMYEAKPVQLNEQQPAMAEKTNTIKASAKVKLTGLEAVLAALGEGKEVEVEVNVDEATAKAIEEKDKEIADLKAENEALKADEKANEEKEADEALKTAQDEATQAKAEVETLKAQHTKEVEDLKAEHVKAIADLKKPVAKAVTGNNDSPGVAEVPGAGPVSPDVKVMQEMVKNLSPMERSRMEINARRKAEAEKK